MRSTPPANVARSRPTVITGKVRGGDCGGSSAHPAFVSPHQGQSRSGGGGGGDRADRSCVGVDRGARAPSCDFDLGRGGSECGERGWSLWDREHHHPEQRQQRQYPYLSRGSCGDANNENIGRGGREEEEGEQEGGSSQCWDEEEHA